MGLKTHGRRGYARAIESDVDLAHFLAERGGPPSRISRGSRRRCSRSRTSATGRPAARCPTRISTGSTGKIANRLLGGGSFFLAPTILKGRAALRVCIVNFRTQKEDLLALLDEAASLGRQIAG